MLGVCVQGFAGIIAGLGIAFYSGWKLAFVILGMVPVIGLAGYFQWRSMSGFGQKTRAAYDEASKIACEAIGFIRTVIILSKEEMFFEGNYVFYCENLKRKSRYLIKLFFMEHSLLLLVMPFLKEFYIGSMLLPFTMAQN